MRAIAAIGGWLIALAFSSIIVVVSVFILEILTAPKTSVLLNIYLEYTPSPLELNTKDLVGEIGATFAVFVIVVTPLVFLFAFAPALIVSAVWESTRKFPSTLVYATMGLITGAAFALLFLLPVFPFSLSRLTDLASNPLRFVLLGGVTGFLGGCVMAWLRRMYFRFALQHHAA